MSKNFTNATEKIRRSEGQRQRTNPVDIPEEVFPSSQNGGTENSSNTTSGPKDSGSTQADDSSTDNEKQLERVNATGHL